MRASPRRARAWTVVYTVWAKVAPRSYRRHVAALVDSMTGERTCDSCAERKAGCVYENGDPNGATLCPTCVAAMTGKEERDA